MLFCRGCNLDCFYCHNRALLFHDAPLLAEETVNAFLHKRAGLLDGVVLSGGEPTLQPDLAQVCAKSKALGYDVKLDTNGQRPDVVRALLAQDLLDYVAVDIKALPECYADTTGTAGYDKAVETLLLTMEAGVPCEGRTTLYPGLSGEALMALAALLPPLPRWRLNVFRMPALCREQDRFRLRHQALTAREAEALLPALREKQPGVTL